MALGALRLVCTAPLDWVAGYDHLLMAIRRLLDKGVDVHLMIPAGGPADEQVRYDIADLSLSKVVSRMGAGNAESLASADLFVLAATRGDHSVLVQAALRCGLPVVAFAAAELTTQVDDAVGVLVPLRDTDGFVDAIARLATDPATRAVLGDNAHRRLAAVLPPR